MNEGEGHFSNRRAARAKDTWRNLILARKAFQKALQLLYGLDDEDRLFCKNVIMRLVIIEWEMAHCHSIKRSKKEQHLQNAENYCDVASKVVVKPPAFEGALEEVQRYRDKISHRRVKLNEDGRKRTWFGKGSVQKMLAM